MYACPFLDILPVHQQSHTFIMQQRQEQFEDLEQALKVMRMIPMDDDDSNTEEKVVLMYLLENGMISMSKQRTSKVRCFQMQHFINNVPKS